MLSDHQIRRVWEHMLAAETRALYFGDLGATYTRRKQIISGLSFVGASGAAVTVISHAPAWVPMTLSLVTAVLTAYTIAVNLDGKIATMAKLFASWHTLARQYDELWNRVQADDAEAVFTKLVEREREPSELAVSAAPHDPPRLKKWQDHVFAMYHLTTPAA